MSSSATRLHTLRRAASCGRDVASTAQPRLSGVTRRRQYFWLDSNVGRPCLIAQACRPFHFAVRRGMGKNVLRKRIEEHQQRKTWTTKLLFPVFACCCLKAAASDGDQVSLLQSGLQQASFASQPHQNLTVRILTQEQHDSHAVQQKPGFSSQIYCKQTKQKKFCFTKLLSSKRNVKNTCAACRLCPVQLRSCLSVDAKCCYKIGALFHFKPRLAWYHLSFAGKPPGHPSS